MKRTRQLLAGVMLLTCASLHGQKFQWARETSSGYMAMISDNSGNVITTSMDGIIECIGSQGDTLWTQSYLGMAYATGLVQDSHGDYYITGSFQDEVVFGDTAITSQKDYDIFIAKVDGATHTFSWVKQISGSDLSGGIRLVADTHGNIYFGGYFIGDCTFGNTTLHSAGDRDIVVTKMDADGNVLWAKAYGGADYDGIIDMKMNGEDVVIAGLFTSSASFGATKLTGKSSISSFACSIHSDGNINWVKGYDYCTLQGLGYDAGNNLYVTGRFTGNVDFGSGKTINTGNTFGDVFLAKLNNQGVALWAVKSTGSYFNVGQAVVTDADNNVYLAGAFSDSIHFGKLAAESHGEIDGFLIKFNSQGEPQWMKSYGGPGQDGANKLSFSQDGTKLYVMGNLQDGPVELDDVVLNGNFSGVTFVGSISGGFSGIEHYTTPEPAFKVYPNPSSGHVSFQWEGALNQAINIQITDISGRLIFQKQMKAGEYSLQIGNLTPGIYMIQSNQNQSAQKLVVY